MSGNVSLMTRGSDCDGMYLTINGVEQGLISSGASSPESLGSDYKGGHEDESIVKGFYYGASNPTNKISGCFVGQPQSHPLIINKMMDKSSPLLHEAEKGELLTMVELKCYRTSYFGRAEHYYTITLEDARVAEITDYMDKDTSQLHQDVYFTYKKITLKHEQANTIAQMDWKSSHALPPQQVIQAHRVGDLIVFNNGFILSKAPRGWGHQTPIHIKGETFYITPISQETALSGLSVILAIAGGFATGGMAWWIWGAGAVLDSRSIWMNEDISYGLGSMAIPPTGKVGMIWATGNATYNGFIRDTSK
ncbi:MAG: hypothetical protein COA44_08575 [Arcobacter sp.]|nr:MAG: hypothetical protein COA44_08575 [Arcobacter sp.]